MNLLALDPAIRRIGWAAITPMMAAPHFGAIDLPKVADNDYAKFLAPAKAWLDAQCKMFEVTHLIYEAPFAGDNPQNTLKIGALNGLIDLYCSDSGITCTSVSIHTWRTATHGFTKAPPAIKGAVKRRKWIKERAIDFARKRGWNTFDDDAAEALCILAFKRGKSSDTENFKNLPLGRV